MMTDTCGPFMILRKHTLFTNPFLPQVYLAILGVPLSSLNSHISSDSPCHLFSFEGENRNDEMEQPLHSPTPASSLCLCSHSALSLVNHGICPQA